MKAISQLTDTDSVHARIMLRLIQTDLSQAVSPPDTCSGSVEGEGEACEAGHDNILALVVTVG